MTSRYCYHKSQLEFSWPEEWVVSVPSKSLGPCWLSGLDGSPGCHPIGWGKPAFDCVWGGYLTGLTKSISMSGLKAARMELDLYYEYVTGRYSKWPYRIFGWCRITPGFLDTIDSRTSCLVSWKLYCFGSSIREFKKARLMVRAPSPQMRWLRVLRLTALQPDV